jgi:hypothetical protein
MNKEPKIAQVAALVGDSPRANTLTALMDGRTLVASELAYVSGVAPQAASAQDHSEARERDDKDMFDISRSPDAWGVSGLTDLFGGAWMVRPLLKVSDI